ncbi:MAG: hypothetical protein IJA78_00370 [Clostridia bacterium]|nr:hypothetical protein [Clostridia bacterium]
MLYPKKNDPQLSHSLFENPTAEYRAAPFWAWNNDLEEQELLRQVDVLQSMGFGGYHMHVRAGMSMPYLSEEFMERIGACVEKAKQKNMLAWLYDEDRWPSGFAGGLVTKDPEYRQCFIALVPEEMKGGEISFRQSVSNIIVFQTDGPALVAYDVQLDEQGALISYRLMKEGETPVGKAWYAYVKTPEVSPRFNNQTYVNTLDKKAIQRFIEITHEAYKKKVGAEFGSTVPSIFTDEPQFSPKNTLPFAKSNTAVTLPWAHDLPETYRERYGEDLLATLPELTWERADGKPSAARHRYHDHVCDRFTEAFSDALGKWCEENGIVLTGHMMQEPSLWSQTAAVGEVMRGLRSFQIPGIDMLADYREYTTAKQAQSVAHQYGREGVMSELYGVTGWDFDFRGHKLQGDWQVALGVTVRVPHLSWVSMGGEAKRDYPASFNYQSPWYKDYRYVEDHFARVTTALTRGTPDVRVGVIHPIESYWLHWGPSEQTNTVREQLDLNFKNVTEWLLFGGVDFDYISESLLPELNGRGGAPLQVGKMAYDVIVVPGCETLRSSTLERLEAFRAAGGKLIFMGEAPRFADAAESARPSALVEKSEQIPFYRSSLLAALEAYRTVEIRDEKGNYTNNLLYQLRCDGDAKWLFIANGKLPYNKDIATKQKIKIRVPGHWSAELYRTLDGTVEALSTEQSDGVTAITYTLYPHDSLLLKLTPHEGAVTLASKPASQVACEPSLPARVPFTLDEPNALLLDKAEYKLDNGDWRPCEELLRADTKIREELGYDPWGSRLCQPWCMPVGTAEHTVSMRLHFETEIPLKGAHLAAELAEGATLTLDGTAVSTKADGYYVDHAIRTYLLPDMAAGTHTVEITMPYGARSALEWCYILGDFGVLATGAYTCITALPKQLAFGDITRQLLPFYSGKITYHLTVTANGERMRLRVPAYRASTVIASVNGGERKQLAFSPNQADFETKAGQNKLDIELYISRTNGFGPVHMADRKKAYVNPAGWRTTGDSWSDSYVLAEEGFLAEPRVKLLK